ncbi:MAG: hypothetical protein IPK31_20020 [Chitinophagaceae bacterium]|nr:hypothetical protein [Chitinophagaceae bacterium]
MPIPEKYLADFEEGCMYHVYNRTNNKEKLFLSDENRRFFLRKYDQYLSSFADTFCWCLLPNHFHFLIKIKSVENIQAYLKSKELKELTPTEKKFTDQQINLSELTEQCFKRFFQSYSLAFNKQHNRKGNLFYKPFKRLKLEKETHFTQAIIYIHANPLKHKLVKDFTGWQWSSWQTMVSASPTRLLRNEVLTWFGNKDRFIEAHKSMIQYYEESNAAIED